MAVVLLGGLVTADLAEPVRAARPLPALRRPREPTLTAGRASRCAGPEPDPPAPRQPATGARRRHASRRCRALPIGAALAPGVAGAAAGGAAPRSRRREPYQTRAGQPSKSVPDVQRGDVHRGRRQRPACRPSHGPPGRHRRESSPTRRSSTTGGRDLRLHEPEAADLPARRRPVARRRRPRGPASRARRPGTGRHDGAAEVYGAELAVGH